MAPALASPSALPPPRPRESHGERAFPGVPVSLVAALVAMVCAGLLATYLPARRITRIDPTAAMRAE